ncbi:DUF2075 domain-containing protein [Companilactobacillus ginsenosidimutans]|uniref:DNA replication initiation protein n=1 Tax=Companilactobacillus ginsenosidimutans TaxID=1007676 RepID=A0A0H4QMN5_9LACO|nr:DUF2075 domain-containing protein [Companilactobacillus ginsenosidimutans]AKP67968.1 DNA replication initiation protein [Companilactobacillus ginsenosidimutans]
MLDSILPNKNLTELQQKVFDKILKFCQTNLQNNNKGIFQLNGDAGTGKSVILTKLFLTLEQDSKRNIPDLQGMNNYFLVNHPELLKVYQDNAGEFDDLRKNRFLRPTTFINQMHKRNKTADIVVIDEAHLLLSESDSYNNFTQKNQLEEVIKLSKVVIFVYDERQVLKIKSYWSQNIIEELKSKYDLSYESSTLKVQMRMQAPDSVINWIDDLTSDLQINTKEITQKDPDYLGGMKNDYDFRIYQDAEKMYQKLREKNNTYGQARIVATADYPSILDGKKHFVDEGNFHLPWDQYNYSKVTWAQKDNTINEIGSIYTVQGFDLNYVAVIMGPSVKYAGKGKIEIDINKYEDQEAFKKRHDDDLKNIDEVKKEIILNSMNVLLKRGIRGVFVYFHDFKIYDYIAKAAEK